MKAEIYWVDAAMFQPNYGVPIFGLFESKKRNMFDSEKKVFRELCMAIRCHNGREEYYDCKTDVFSNHSSLFYTEKPTLLYWAAIAIPDNVKRLLENQG